MRKIGLALVLILIILLSSGAMAKAEKIAIPYGNLTINVSFDLGDNSNYIKIIEDPEYAESYSGVKSIARKLKLEFSDNNMMYLILEEDEIPIDASPEANKQFIKEYFQELGIYNPLIYDRIIDNLPGVLGVGNRGSSKIYHAIYWPVGLCLNSKKCMGFTSCEIRSNCDWDTTKNMLNTIHIE